MGFELDDGSGNSLSQNTAKSNTLDGFFVLTLPFGNTLSSNAANSNGNGGTRIRVPVRGQLGPLTLTLGTRVVAIP